MLYPGYAALRVDTFAACGTRSKLAKVVAYTRAGSHRDIPADVPVARHTMICPCWLALPDAGGGGGSWRGAAREGLQGGWRLQGRHRLVRRALQLGARLQRRLEPLDRIDIL